MKSLVSASTTITPTVRITTAVGQSGQYQTLKMNWEGGDAGNLPDRLKAVLQIIHRTQMLHSLEACCPN